MYILHFFELIFLFLISSLGPGFLITRKMKLTPLENMAASIGFSFLFIYFTSFTIYILNLPHHYYFIITGVCLIAALKNKDELLRIVSQTEVVRVLLYFAILFVWCFVFLTLIRHYSGALWIGDWLEHYRRSLFFLNHLSVNTKFLGMWLLPARPPFMNLVAGFYMGQIGQHFYIFQIIFFLLNLMVFFPACLVVQLMVRKQQYGILLLTSLLMFNPMFLQNVTFTWTKLFTANFVILGVYFYVRYLEKAHYTYVILSFAYLSIGLLVHFSAGPYFLFIILHYLFFVLFNRYKRWKEIILSGFISLIILLSWFCWSIWTYGIKDTFFSNSTILDYSRFSISQNILKAGQNILYTFIPHPFRDVSLVQIKQVSFLGYIRDYMFFIYQTNLIFALGIAGGLLIIYLLWIEKKAGTVKSNERWFWLLFLAFSTFIGIAVRGELDKFGLAHITLQPIVILGIVFLSVKIWNCSRLIKIFVLIMLAIDSLLGIFLHFSLQNRIFHIVKMSSGKFALTMQDNLTQWAAFNYDMKIRHKLVFWGDFFSSASVYLQLFLGIFGCLILIYLGKRLYSDYDIS